MLVEPETAPRPPLREVYRTIAWQTTGRIVFANVGGATVVFAFVQFAAPSRGIEELETHLYFMALLGYVALVAPIVAIAAVRSTRTVQAWVDADRPPTPDEKIAVLEQPYLQTRFTFRAWLGAAVFFTVFTIGNEIGVLESLRIALGIVLGGATTSGLCFLLVERMHRPAFAIALSDGVLPERHGIQVRSRLLLMWALGSGVPFLGILLSPVGRPAATRASVIAPIVVLAVIGLVVGFVLSTIAARAVSDPIDELRDGLERVAAGDLNAHIPVNDGGELGALEAGYNRMLEGLRERNRLEDLFGRHVGVEVAKRALEQGVELGGQVRDVSVLFVDLIASTGLALSRPPNEVVDLLNAFFGVVVTVVEQNHGTVSRFDGDGALCVFGALEDDPQHATNVLRAARELATALEVLGAQYPEIKAGIGVSTGPVVAGNIGARQRFEYTVIGDAANEASRLTDLAKGSAGRVLVSAKSVHAALPIEQEKWDYVGAISLRGRDQLTETYEPAETRGPEG